MANDAGGGATYVHVFRISESKVGIAGSSYLRESKWVVSSEW